jgi:membrane fusion protein (multidrug efflux system)
MSKRTRWIVLSLIVVIIAGMILYPALRRNRRAREDNKALATAAVSQPRQRTLSVNAEIVAPVAMSEKTVSIGNMIPYEEVDLMFEATGKVIGIYFEEGQHVAKGTLLAKMNDQPLLAQLKKLEAQVKLARDRVDRQQTLLSKDAVSQEAYDIVVTEYNKLMADIDLVKANIAQTELRAPFDGVIGFRYLSEGAYASPSATVARLAMISTLRIDFPVPEKYASEMKPGKKVTFNLRGGNGLMRNYQATVYAVESEVDLATRSLRVRATFPNADEAIVPGTFVSMEIERASMADALSVPSEAIIPEMGRNLVYLYRGGKAQPAEIETGLRTDSRVQAIAGLTPGDTLITSGVMQLRTGMDVTIDNLKQTTPER